MRPTSQQQSNPVKQLSYILVIEYAIEELFRPAVRESPELVIDFSSRQSWAVDPQNSTKTPVPF